MGQKKKTKEAAGSPANGAKSPESSTITPRTLFIIANIAIMVEIENSINRNVLNSIV